MYRIVPCTYDDDKRQEILDDFIRDIREVDGGSIL